MAGIFQNVKVSLTPEGVEHNPFRSVASWVGDVKVSLTPEGVEHHTPATKMESLELVKVSLTPEGVEHVETKWQSHPTGE